MKHPLTLDVVLKEAEAFLKAEWTHDEPTLFGITDGKAVGTYLEQKFTNHLMERYTFPEGNSALGIDIPSLDLDIKVTSIRQPQSSCPFKSARQKIYGLGYHLIIFVYEKTDNEKKRTSRLNIQHAIFVEKSCTADFQTTKRIHEILDTEGGEDDLVAFFQDIKLPVDEIEARNIAQEVLRERPQLGYLTISNALQWRLQYGRVIQKAGDVEGVKRIT